MTSNAEQQRINEQARTAAQAAVEGLALNPTGLVQYQSRGRILVVGDEDAQLFAARIEDPLHAQVLMLEGEPEPGVPVIQQGGRRLEVGGHLGAFRIALGDEGKANYETIDIDLIADLGKRPLIDRELPPPGYFHCSLEPQALDALLIELQELVGTFEKPKFFQYDAAICAHGRSGQPGCDRCLQTCPAEAITSLGERIEVNPNLCQGGGICAAVCPTGAIQYAYPSPADTLARIRKLLRGYAQAGGTDAAIWFVAEADAPQLGATPGNVLLVLAEELGSVGLEAWLSALAWGAREVRLLDGGSVPAGVRAALAEQVGFAAALLGGMGYPGDAVRLQSIERLADGAGMPDIAPAAFDALPGKREALGMALDHLVAEAPSAPALIPLPAGAPFGEIRVNTEGCTLCMACTSICPAGALHAGNETPALVFVEANCVQCGICASGCPEQVISLTPGFRTDATARRGRRTLHEEPPFLCVSCGKPFATRSVIDNMLQKLAGHYMFQNERARRRLQMCEDCRVIDAVQDQEAMESGLDLGDRDPH